MSVLKKKRSLSKAEFINVAHEIYIETIDFLTKLSARYSRLMAEPIAKLAGEVQDNAEKANSIFPSSDQRKQMREAYLLKARASLMALDRRLGDVYEILSKNPQGCFTNSKGDTLPASEATQKLDKRAQRLGELLYQRHRELIPDPVLRAIADTVIDTAPGTAPGRGMPLGVEPSQQEMMSMPSAIDNWIKCQLGVHCAGHYADDYFIVCPDLDKLRRIGNAIVRKFEVMGIPVNRKKCKLTPLTKPFKFCKAKFTLHESGKVTVNGCRDGVKRARRKLRLFRSEWLAGKRTLEEVAQYMTSQLAYYRNYNDHGRILRLRRLCYAIFDRRIACTKSRARVTAPTSA